MFCLVGDINDLQDVAYIGLNAKLSQASNKINEGPDFHSFNAGVVNGVHRGGAHPGGLGQLLLGDVVLPEKSSEANLHLCSH
ncbi:hypothetical protein A2G07_10180 [Deinococcus radiodurans R1 = ATCC 13939 = DSM 20539]|nr:hypothetical protein A2G07_10180 [Deinococcus radiodurans R1 = ATCC 13939 = DSM 20539]